MKKGGGHQKGSNFERDMARKLSLWWTQDFEEPRDDIFWRTSGSGARATTRTKLQKKTAYEYGDIGFRDPIGKPLIDCMLIECKKGYSKDVDILDLFHNEEKALLFLWWKKALKEMESAGRKNCMLILARNRRSEVCFINKSFFEERSHISGNFPGNRIEIFYANSLVVIRLEDFFEWIDPVTIKLDII